MRFVVKTRDVDGGTTRAYKSRAGAVKRFEEMLGYTMDNAIDELFHATPADTRPKADNVRCVRGVSMFGTVVTFTATE